MVKLTKKHITNPQTARLSAFILHSFLNRFLLIISGRLSFVVMHEYLLQGRFLKGNVDQLPPGQLAYKIIDVS